MGYFFIYARAKFLWCELPKTGPMTSILLSYELFGGKGVELMALAIAVSYMTSGYHSLFHSQKIAYSKTKAKYIDVFSDDNIDE